MRKIRVAVLSLITTLSFSQLSLPVANATAPTISNISAGSTIVGAHTYTIHISTPPRVGSYPRLQFRSTSNSSIAIAFNVRFTTIGDHDFIFNPLILGSENVSRDPNVDYGGSTDVNRMLDPGTYNITLDYMDSSMSLLTQTISSITFLNPCAPGTYSTDGGQPLDNSGCYLAALGHYVAGYGATSAPLCPAGHTAITQGQMSCDPAPAGYSSAAGTGNQPASACEVGTYQPLSGQAVCLASDAGYYVNSAHSTSQTPCETGTYQPDTAQTSCINATPGHYVGATGGNSQTACSAGSYQPNSASASCIQALANFYVTTSAATSQIACPTNYTSAAGSDSVDDCIAPLTSTTQSSSASSIPTLNKGKKKTLKSLAIEIGMAVSTKDKVSGSLSKTSKKICKISGAKIKGLAYGTCQLTLKVKPKKGNKTTKSTSLTIQ